MRLGPFTVSKASIGAQSAAAGQRVRDEVATGWVEQRNAQTMGRLGDQVLTTGLAMDLNRARATVAKEETSVKALIAQNPEYIGVDEVRDRGVEISDNEVITDEAGNDVVRTYSVAKELYKNAVDTGVSQADEKFLFPSVRNRLQSEVDSKYKVNGQHAIDTWATKQQQRVAQTEYLDIMDEYRVSGDYEAAAAATTTALAGNIISSEEASNQHEITSVSSEMRDTNNVIIAAENSNAGVPDLLARIEDYETAIADNKPIAHGMSPDKMYAERNRMMARLSRIEAANNTRQSLTLVKANRELSAVVDGIPKGLNTISPEEIDTYQRQLNEMTRTGAGTPTQRENLQYKIYEAKVVSNNSAAFTDIIGGSAAESQEAEANLILQSYNYPPEFATEAMVLQNKAREAGNRRDAALASAPSQYAAEHDNAARMAFREFKEQGTVEALKGHLNTQDSSQARLGVSVSGRKAFSPTDPFIIDLADTLTTGTWRDKAATLDGFGDELTTGEYTMLARSLGASTSETQMAQIVMQTYNDAPEIARKIDQGSKLDNVSVSPVEFNKQVLAAAGDTLDPEKLSAYAPALMAYYKSQVAAGVEGFSHETDPDSVEQAISDVLGPEVDLGFSWSSPLASYDGALRNSDNTRSYRDRSGAWVPPAMVRDQINDKVQTEADRVFNVGGVPATLSELALNARVRVVGNGRYRLDIEQEDGTYLPLLTEGMESGDVFIIDLIEGRE